MSLASRIPRGTACASPRARCERDVPELLLVRERAFCSSAATPRLDARGDAGERTGLEQGVEGLEVRVDRDDAGRRSRGESP